MNPILQQAVEYIFVDQGLTTPSDFVLPAKLDNGEDINWDRVAGFLNTLSAEDLETFCIGDHDDMHTLAMEGSEDGDYAMRAMDTLFLNIVCGED